MDVSWETHRQAALYGRGFQARWRRGMGRFYRRRYPVVSSQYQYEDRMMRTTNNEIKELLLEVQAELKWVRTQLEGGSAGAVLAAGDGQFAAVRLVATMTDGKVYWNVQGGAYSKFGVRIWPEHLFASGFSDLDPAETYDLLGYTAVYSEDDEGRKKVIALRRAGTSTGSVNGASAGSGDGASAGSGDGASAGSGDGRPHWLRECEEAENGFMFDTALAKLEPWFRDADTAERFRVCVFGEWDGSADVRALTAGMLAYADWRNRLTAGAVSHEKAKAKARAKARLLVGK